MRYVPVAQWWSKRLIHARLGVRVPPGTLSESSSRSVDIYLAKYGSPVDTTGTGAAGPFCVYMSETFSRSLLKTIVWRVIATFITYSVVYTFTGSFGKATTITLTAATFLAIGYYIHERIWDRLQWGRRNKAYSK